MFKLRGEGDVLIEEYLIIIFLFSFFVKSIEKWEKKLYWGDKSVW